MADSLPAIHLHIRVLLDAVRVAWAGTGINMRQARRIGDEFARYDAPRRAVELLEGLL